MTTAIEHSIQKSALLLANLALHFTQVLRGYKLPRRRRLYMKYLLYFLVYGKRQVEAICVLVGQLTYPIYAEQAGQLLRVLTELTIKLAWMMNCEDEEAREYRAWQLEKASVKVERLPDDEEGLALEMLGVRRYEEESGRVIKGIPTVKQMADSLDAADEYQFYRWESSRIHLSSSSLSSVLSFQSEQDSQHKIIADVPDHPSIRARVLWLTLVLMDRIGKETLPRLDIDTSTWNTAIQEAYTEIIESLSSLMELPPDGRSSE